MKWKKLVNWWGVGSLALGVAAILARRSRKRGGIEKPIRIPEELENLEIETEIRETAYQGTPYLSSARYQCSPTRFRVWSFLRARNQDSAQGLRIFHVSPEVRLRHPDKPDQLEILPEEKFYATLHLVLDDKRDALPGIIGRGRRIEFHKCHVGGSLNGVETGERIVSMTPIAAYRLVRCRSASVETR